MNPCQCQKIQMLSDDKAIEMAEKHLKKVQDHPKAWKALYVCPVCEQHWELTYPAAGDVCCVEPELCKVSQGITQEDYRLTYPSTSSEW